MDWNNPDAYPGESEEEYIARTREESESAAGLMFTLAGLALLFLKIAAVFGVFIYVGYLLSRKLLGENADKFKIWGFAILFTYLIFCIIYFLKGAILGLRAKNHRLWIVPWIICVLLCCIFPAFIVKSVVAGMFNLAEKQNMLCIGLSWGAFAVSVLYIYGIYKFKTPAAPKILHWSYISGRKSVDKFITK